MSRAFFPCLWCGAPIEPDRSKSALTRGRPPVYCSDACRRHDPNRSLVMRIYRASENAAEARGFEDFADFDRSTHEEYRSRLAAAVKDEA